jgi:hypothetical protein
MERNIKTNSKRPNQWYTIVESKWKSKLLLGSHCEHSERPELPSHVHEAQNPRSSCRIRFLFVKHSIERKNALQDISWALAGASWFGNDL